MIVVLPDTSGIDAAVEALHRDEIVAYPTETVYGLAVNPFSETALDRLFAAKQRDPLHAVLVIIGDEGQLDQVARDRDRHAAAYIKAFWPGPLTLLLPKADAVSRRLTGDSAKIAVRCPACKVARALCLAFGGPLTSTSANISGAAPASSIAMIDVGDVTLVVDGGVLPESPPSTIFDPEKKTILREGAVSEEALRAAYQ